MLAWLKPPFPKKIIVMSYPKAYYFRDDGLIPNSPFPLLIYEQVFDAFEQDDKWLEKRFASNNWTNSWRWGIYPFHHYHSNAHEVLGIYKGEALLMIGGEKGEQIMVRAGDILIIPAGVAHKCISHTIDFTVLGAYSDGLNPDLNKGETEERYKIDDNLASVPFPNADPFEGKMGGLMDKWR